MGFFSRAFLVFLMKESKKRRQKQLCKLMAKSCSQLANLPGAWPLMNPLSEIVNLVHIQWWIKGKGHAPLFWVKKESRDG